MMQSLVLSSLPLAALGILVIAFIVQEHSARRSDDRQDKR